MGTFQPLRAKRSLSSTPVASTSSFLRPSHSLVPTSLPATQTVAPPKLERVARFGHSFERIPVHSPERSKEEQTGAIATAASPSVSSLSDQHSLEATLTEEHANSARTPHFGRSFTSIPLFSTVQRKAALSSPLQEEGQLGSRIQAARGSGYSLDNQTQQMLEQGLGTDLSSIRIHTDSEANDLARSVNALAFTTESDIFFRSGMYRPDSRQGLHLLIHEATHTIQQATGPVAGKAVASGISISDPDDRFEQAADASATQVLTHSSQHDVLSASNSLAQPSIYREISPVTQRESKPVTIQRGAVSSKAVSSKAVSSIASSASKSILESHKGTQRATPDFLQQVIQNSANYYFSRHKEKEYVTGKMQGYGQTNPGFAAHGIPPSVHFFKGASSSFGKGYGNWVRIVSSSDGVSLSPVQGAPGEYTAPDVNAEAGVYCEQKDIDNALHGK